MDWILEAQCLLNSEKSDLFLLINRHVSEWFAGVSRQVSLVELWRFNCNKRALRYVVLRSHISGLAVLVLEILLILIGCFRAGAIGGIPE